MRLVPPITPTEFLHHFRRCMPPQGWPANIAVANSGGPDSTALLFLLSATLRTFLEEVHAREYGRTELNKNASIVPSLPQIVFSIHVNHNLQAAAMAMQETATQTARRLDVRSVVTEISWGKQPFPTKPEAGMLGGERLLREARYSKLFEVMHANAINAIAFAHHADDQVETTIMRMSRGSSARGLAGMRPVRRWGMGQKDRTYNYYGAEGMNRWIVRPLLHFSKDRLLATCEANELPYVNDPTNFQPGLTIRNTIRHALSVNGTVQRLGSVSLDSKVNITPYVERLRAMAPDARGPDQLREAVRLFGVRLEEVDTQVTNIITHARLPSPPSTLLLTTPGLASATAEEVRTALIRRCLRYVSPGPWGSIWAEGGGEHDTYRRIARELWPVSSSSPDRARRRFTAGAGVVAIPVTVLPSKNNAVRFREVAADGDEIPGWIFARAPHYQKGVGGPENDVADITNGLLAADKGDLFTHSVLYDHRFAVEFQLLGFPDEVRKELVEGKGRLTVEPDTMWSLPKIVLTGKETGKVDIGKALWHLNGWQNTCRQPLRLQSWLMIRFVRSLDAV